MHKLICACVCYMRQACARTYLYVVGRFVFAHVCACMQACTHIHSRTHTSFRAAVLVGGALGIGKKLPRCSNCYTISCSLSRTTLAARHSLSNVWDKIAGTQMQASVQAWTHLLRCMRLHACTQVHARVHIHANVRARTHANVHMHACTHACTRARTRTRMHESMHAHYQPNPPCPLSAVQEHASTVAPDTAMRTFLSRWPKAFNARNRIEVVFPFGPNSTG